MSVESAVSPSSASPSSSASQSEIVPAFMLAALVAITGMEAMMLMTTPHKAMAHPVMSHPARASVQVAQVFTRH